jgi:hypothetical protein
VAPVRQGGRTLEQGLCVQQRPQLLPEPALPTQAAEADRTLVLAGLRRARWRVCGGAGQRIALGLAAQVSEPGGGQFAANDGVHRGLLGEVTGLYPEGAAKVRRRESAGCPVSGAAHP